jgi:hypothetical protein
VKNEFFLVGRLVSLENLIFFAAKQGSHVPVSLESFRLGDEDVFRGIVFICVLFNFACWSGA